MQIKGDRFMGFMFESKREVLIFSNRDCVNLLEEVASYLMNNTKYKVDNIIIYYDSHMQEHIATIYVF
jgi:hypothetical protein